MTEHDDKEKDATRRAPSRNTVMTPQGTIKLKPGILALWDAELEAEVRPQIAELDRRAVEAQARALTIVVTNGKGTDSD